MNKELTAEEVVGPWRAEEVRDVVFPAERRTWSCLQRNLGPGRGGTTQSWCRFSTRVSLKEGTNETCGG